MQRWLVCLVLALIGCDRGLGRRSLAGIASEPAAVDFGTLAPGTSATTNVAISNTGSAELHISSFAIRSGTRMAFRLGPTPSRLLVGERVEVAVTYDAPPAEGVDGASVEIESDADNASVLLIPLGGRSAAPCPMGQDLCGTSCVSLATDPAHCGRCDAGCESGQLCVTGACRACMNNLECGSQACVGGRCRPCASNAQCSQGQACVAGACGSCAARSECDVDAGEVCFNGACGSCATNTMCGGGLACVSGRCGPCTSANQCASGEACVNGACAPCVTNAQCRAEEACLTGTCGPCTSNGQCDADAGQVCGAGRCLPCGDAGACDPGLVCLAGRCGPCSGSMDCSGGQVCLNQRCVACTGNAQCAAGQACLGGRCGSCTDDPDCTAGQACVGGACVACTTDFCTQRGLIVAWSGTLASIPAGWQLADGTNGTPDLRGWFVRGAPAGANPGTTGGSATHAHGGTTGTAIVTTASAGTSTCGVSVGGTSFIAPPAAHVHTLTHSHGLVPANHLPPYFEVAYIVKTGAVLAPPDGVIVGWTAAMSPAGGWLPLDGVAAVPDLRGRFLRGAGVAQNPGGIGGSLTHDHDGGTLVDSSNTNNAAIGGFSFAGNAGPGCGLSGEYGHFHAYPHAHGLAAADNLPPYTLVTWVTASNAPTFPRGAIALWMGSVVAPPRGWSVCDGTNGTPDLTQHFLRGTRTSELPGTSGGAATHNHGGTTVSDDGGVTTLANTTNSPAGGATAMSTHTHDLPPHSHPVSSDSNVPPYIDVVFLMKR